MCLLTAPDMPVVWTSGKYKAWKCSVRVHAHPAWQKGHFHSEGPNTERREKQSNGSLINLGHTMLVEKTKETDVETGGGWWKLAWEQKKYINKKDNITVINTMNDFSLTWWNVERNAKNSDECEGQNHSPNYILKYLLVRTNTCTANAALSPLIHVWI